MRRISLVLLAATSLGFVGVQAHAADMAIKYAPPPPPAPVYSWTGFYIGINGGAGWGTTTSSVDVGQTLALNGISGASLVVPLAQTSLDGWLFGGQVGYNYQIGNYVLGIEGDGDWTNISGTSPCLLVFNCTSKVDWTADVTGRLGILPFANLLVYLKGGVTWARENDSFGNSGSGTNVGGFLTFNGSVNSSLSETRIGGLLGIGTEYAIDHNWRAKIEYDYADYGKHSETPLVTAAGAACLGSGCTPTGGSITFPAVVQTQLQIHTVKAGINYNF